MYNLHKIQKAVLKSNKELTPLYLLLSQILQMRLLSLQALYPEILPQIRSKFTRQLITINGVMVMGTAMGRVLEPLVQVVVAVDGVQEVH